VAPQPRHAIGEDFSVGYWSYRCNRAIWQRYIVSGFETIEQPDAEFLIVDLLVQNNDRTSSTLPPLKLVDAQGREFDESSKGSLMNGSFDILKRLNPGVSSRGFVVFDAPRGDYMLKFSGGFESEKYAIVDMSSERKPESGQEPSQASHAPETAAPNEESAPIGQAQSSQPQAIHPDRSADNQTSATEQSVPDAVGAWVQAFRSKDSTALADSYAPVVERYFRRNNVSHQQIRQYIESSFARMVDIRKYEVNDIRVGMLPGDNPSNGTSYSRATATFRKTWDTLESDGRSFTGEEIEQLTFTSSPQGWKIIREEELKILRVSRH
jgi:ketosteroid isomerase-like protein